MMRALYAAISGLSNHVTYLDVVGNNIANVNTQGFKASRVTFQDMLSQTIQGASAPTAERGGTNPNQVGLGMKVGGIDVIHTQGSLQSTGRNTDFAIQGSGFFILKDGEQSLYTRDGAFDVAVTGELVNPTNGMKVQGWRADNSGVVDTSTPIGSIMIPFGQSIGAQATTDVTFNGNLDSRLEDGATVSTTIDVYDSLGKSHAIEVTFTKNAVGTWDVTAEVSGTDDEVGNITVDPAQVQFDAQGRITDPDDFKIGLSIDLEAGETNAESPMELAIDVAGVTQFAAAPNMAMSFNNGFSAGSLLSFSVGPGGDITGIFSNGTTRALGQIAMAVFTNPAGLQRAGSNSFEATSNSGVAQIGTPGTGGRGMVGTGVLEGSNTDLAREFTNVVIAQRGFQASSRIISTSDQMLEGLVNLIR